MRFQATTILSCIFCLFLTVAITHAADYKNWLDLLPASIDGLEKAGDPEGANMESGGKSWSSLEQDYAGDSNRHIDLVIVTGAMSPQVRTFNNMPDINMESEGKIAKSLEVSGYQAFLELNKNNSSGRLIIAVQEQTIVVIKADPVDGEKKLLSLADQVPLDRIAREISS